MTFELHCQLLTIIENHGFDYHYDDDCIYIEMPFRDSLTGEYGIDDIAVTTVPELYQALGY